MTKLLAMAAAGLFLGTASINAQLTELVGMTNSIWKYSSDSSDQYALGFPNVDDSAWPEGRALFGNDTGYPYPFVTTVPGGITSYYRTRFNFAGGISGVVLTMTNHIDDGLVIFLNGTEIARYNLNLLPTDPVAHATVAPVANPLGEPVRIVHQASLDSLTNGLANPLVAGENVIAVSVHNNSSASTDTVFGMSVYSSRSVPPCTPTIAPAGAVNVVQCTSVTLTLTLAADCGVPAPTIQWYKDDAAIAGQTGMALTLNNVQDVDEGVYFARLSNSAGTKDSATATLNVNDDTQGPVIQSVSAPATPDNEWIVTFNEAVLPFGGGDDNLTYEIKTKEAAGVPPTILTVETATIEAGNPAQVRLKTTESRVPGKSYTYLINQDIIDLCAGQVTPAGASGDIYQTVLLVDWTDNRNWTYNQSGADQGTAWRAVGFDDSSWSVGPQGFGNETGANFPDAPDSQRTPLTRNPEQTTYYFRTTFNLPAGALNVRFYADVDDGAAVYINGTEVGRVNIAAGLPLAFDTLTPNLYDPDAALYMPVGGLLIPSSVLVPGNNVLAIEVHQNAVASSDILMICRITAETTVVEVEPPQIVTQPASTSVAEGRSFTLTVLASPPGLTYQWSKDGVDIPGANASTYTAVADASSGGAYRVTVSNSMGSLTSDPANVTVRRLITPHGTTWKYNTNCLDGTSWTATAFDDSLWLSGPAPLGIETTAATLLRIPPIATPLPPPAPTFLTTYFRTTVTIPPVGPGEGIFLSHIVDDGAAFYIDGKLALVYNLVGAPSSCTNVAPAAAPGDGDAREVVVPINLTSGTHTLAVEVHQNSATSSDIVFSAELTRAPALPALTITHPTPTTVLVSWTPATGVRLFESATADGAFTAVAGNPQGSFSAASTAGNRYFRLGY